jgi:hypothetical protein
MSDKPELPFERRHRQSAEKEGDIAERRERSNYDKQNAKNWVKVRTYIHRALNEVAGNKKEQHRSKIEKRCFDGAQIVLLIATVIITGLTYRVFYRQLKEMQVDATQQHADTMSVVEKTAAANRIAEKNMQKDQRAWIEFSATNITTFKVGRGKPIQFDINVLDIGKTAARHIQTFIVIERLPPTQAPSFKVDIGKRNTTTIGALFPNDPRGNYSVPWWKTHYGDPAIMSAADVRDWKSGKYYLAVYGMTTYYDIFGVYHWVTFCAGLAGLNYLPTPTRECVETYNDVDDNE